tara:strand:+ start:1198 stop:1392 length:195 start_codon:yes stop_codon:yes gene_type:complete
MIHDQPRSGIIDAPALIRSYGICRRMRIATGIDLNNDKRAAPPHHNVNFVDRSPQSPGKGSQIG